MKAELKNRLYQRSQSADAPKTWTDEDETAFVKRLFDELDKVYDFKQLKSMEIDQRIKDSQKNVERVVKMLNSRQSAEGDVGYSSEEEPTAEDFDLLELELSDIIADVHDLAKFAQLNYTGFQKIIKKHDVGSPLPVLYILLINVETNWLQTEAGILHNAQQKSFLQGGL